MHTYNIKWTILLSILLVGYSFRLAKKYHWSAGLLFAYVSINTLRVAFWPYSEYAGLPPGVQSMLGGNAAKSILIILSLVVFIDCFKMKHFLKFYLGVQIMNAWYVIGQSFFKDYVYRVGFFDNISLNGGLMALAVPIILSISSNTKYKFFVTCSLITAVCLSKASVPFGVLAVCLAAYFFMKSRHKLIPILLFFMCIGSAYLFDGNRSLPFYQEQRFKMYEIQTKAFFKDEVCYPEHGKTKCVEKGNVFTGYGQGTYPFWAFLTQLSYYLTEGLGQKGGEIFNFVHSDWLQLMLENGIIGLILSLLLASYLTYFVWGNPLMFSLLMGYFSFMIYCYPIHYPFHAFFGLWIIAQIMYNYQGRKTSGQTISI